ncbi:MAG: hypothetical protein K2O15_14840 [Lachnospiraceae bacterium]|nr:hypothetical protein [Lachnospiraceae bacterium]
MHRRISEAVTVLTLAALILTGCTSEASSISSARGKADGVVDTGFTLSTVGSYDSADTAVVLSTDERNKAVTLINMDTGKQYTLYYDGTTYVQDKYNGPMTISQIKAGDVVDVTFLKGKKQLASIKLSPEAWVYNDVYNYDLTGVNKTASIGSQTYALPEEVVVLSEGRRVDKAEVVSQDVVSISGIAHKIYSVSVEKGHGYLSLKNEQPLLGGWIEVGNSVIRQITEDMLLVVPEGTYQVTLSNNGIGCVKNVTIERDKEVVLDVDDIEIPEDKTGKILFNVSPDTAKVSVDGKPVDISKAVELTYGIHRVEATASGYDTLTKHIQVGSEYATISFTLEETRKEDRDSVSGNSITRDPWEDTYTPADVNSVSDDTLSSVSDNTLRSSKNGTVEVHVKEWGTDKELKGVTVRLQIEDSKEKITYDRSKDSPCSFTKDEDADTYRFILSKSGYKTKTFEPDLEDADKDETIYFMLEKEGTTNNNTNTAVGNISSEIISAIATVGRYFDLTNGSETDVDDAYIHSTGNQGNLWTSGKEKIIAAATEAVQKIVGTDGIGAYKFTVADSLKDVVVLESGGYEATASVTVSRSGYKEETIPVRIVIKEEAEEKKIGVTVISDKEEVAAGDTVTFTAEVKNGDETIEGAEVSWNLPEDEIDAWFREDGNSLTIEVNSVENTIEYSVSATYKDADGDSFESDSATVTIKASETEPDPDEGEGNGDDTDDGTEDDDPDIENPDNTGDGSQGTENPDGIEGDGQSGESRDDLNEETVTLNQNAHPIRNFFSSLFK